MATGAHNTAYDLELGTTETRREDQSQQTAEIVVQRGKPSAKAGQWATSSNIPAFQLCASRREESHYESLSTDGWFNGHSCTDPTPVVHLKNTESAVCGIVHLRHSDTKTEVCLSLVTATGIWQTGIWLEIEPGDELGISWYADWHGREISAINMEILKQTQH